MQAGEKIMVMRANTPEDYFYSIISNRLYVRGRRRKGHKWGGQGYKAYCYCGKTYASHRLIWFLVTGKWPEHEIDHIDKNKGNDNWLNLREADDKTNPQNRFAHSNNKLGVRGVHMTACGTYKVELMKDGKIHHLGNYKTLEEAVAVRKEAERKYFTHAV